MVTVSPFFALPTTSPCKPAWPRRLTLSAATVAGPGTSMTGSSVSFFITGFATAAAFLTTFFLALATAFFTGALVFVTTGAITGAGAAGAARAGGGISGSLLVLTCATAEVAIIVPKINQQFVFINQKSEFLFPPHSTSAICPASIRRAGFFRSASAVIFSPGDPSLVFAQQVPDGVQQLGLHALEIEVEHDQRPARAVVIGQGFFDDGAHAFEEVVAQGGFSAGGVGGVRDHRPPLAGGGIDGPPKILFDAHGEAGLQRAIDAVLKIAFVRIAVVRVQNRPVVIEKVEVGLGKQRQGRHDEQQGSHQRAG